MIIEIITKQVIPAAMTLLPEKMDSDAARAMLLAIALQESKLQYRKQVPVAHARSFWQFEEGTPETKSGLAGLRIHPWTYKYFREILNTLKYRDSIATFEIHRIVEHNDILACAFARLLLYTIPKPLPRRGEYDNAWDQYIFAWRPGKPHRETWNGYYDQAWQEIYDSSSSNSSR